MLIRWFYTLLLAIVSPFLLLSLYKKKDGKPSVGKRWKEHFGFTQGLHSTTNPIWIHAVSVGETLAVTPLIMQLKLKYPEVDIVLTTTTPTGAEQAGKLGSLVTHRYMPLDFPFAVQRFIRTINPCKLIIMETELWPNTLHIVAKNNIPISVINARLSERSYKRYSRVQPLFNLLIRNLSQVLCQYDDDAKRFVKLGVPLDKVFITGSIKFDVNINNETLERGNKLRNKIGRSRPVWIAASTHKGEDEQILNTHRILLGTYPTALLILVPRHPERFNSVFELCTDLGFVAQRRTQHNLNKLNNSEVYLGDTMGEMLTLIQAADVCFMGGSLIGSKAGGHNVLEPAALGKPIISGSSYFNFTEIVQRLLTKDAIIIVDSEQALSNILKELFGSPERMSNQGKNGAKCVTDNQGSLSKTLGLIID